MKTLKAGQRPSRGLPLLAIVSFTVVAVLRVVATYSEFTHTTDEPAHLAAGIEWFDRGDYWYDTVHPPLARIAVGIGPYLAGLRSAGKPSMWEEGMELLYGGGRYQEVLSLARAGTLVFVVAAILAVFLLARRLYGVPTAVVAVLLFSTLPPILAHGGQATNDMSVTATIPFAVLASMYWAERPTLRRSALLGCALGLAVLSKFTAFAYLAVSVPLAVALVRGSRNTSDAALGWRGWIGRIAACLVVAGLLVWGGYRFSFGAPPEGELPTIQAGIDDVFGGSGTLHGLASSAVRARLPAPALFLGLGRVLVAGARGHSSYLLGENRTHGWWYFFPVALGVKTPLPFLVLVLCGSIAILTTIRPGNDLPRLLPLACAAGLLLSVLPSPINLGLRHILPIYPFLAVVAAAGLTSLCAHISRLRIGLLASAMLLTWHLVSSVEAHPDYLAYFNALAGRSPERILINSDLDWGQDLHRLEAALADRRIQDVSLCYPWNAELGGHRLPRYRSLNPYERPSGWVALSVSCIYRGTQEPPYDQYAWAKDVRDYVPVGRTIRLFRLP